MERDSGDIGLPPCKLFLVLVGDLRPAPRQLEVGIDSIAIWGVKAGDPLSVVLVESPFELTSKPAKRCLVLVGFLGGQWHRETRENTENKHSIQQNLLLFHPRVFTEGLKPRGNLSSAD